MRNIHILLTLLSLNIILLSVNRLTPITSGHLAPFEFLRWLDFNAMLPIPLMAVIIYWLLKLDITKNAGRFLHTPKYAFLSILMISGIYLFAAGSGTHEFANYLHFRYCNNTVINDALCNIIIYNDDQFSHYVYYAGFILMNVALMLLEFKLPRKPVSKNDIFLILSNALFIALGIFANLAFEEIGIDLWIFASVMFFSLYLLYQRKWNVKSMPVTFYFALSYSLGVIGTFICKSLMF